MPDQPRTGHRETSRSRRPGTQHARQRAASKLSKSKELVARATRFQLHANQQLARAAELSAQLRSMRRLGTSGGEQSHAELRRWLGEVLDAAIEFTEADFGCIQVVDRTKQALRMVAQRGFSPEFLRYFEEVHDGQATCGTAMQRMRRVIVEDVERNPIFRDSKAREVMLKAHALACQSTPLFGRSGKIIAVLSTQYKVARRPPPRGLRLLDLLAWQIQSQIDDLRIAAVDSLVNVDD